MYMMNQQEAIIYLNNYAMKNRQAILISGPEGCGKTYLAKHYSELLNISEFHVVESKMDTIREVMTACAEISAPVVLCIENLDMAVMGVSYAILKFLEEPKHNIFIVITCRNIRQIPDTIVSRCVTIDVPPMIQEDLSAYAKSHYADKLDSIKDNETLWKCVKSISDMDLLSNLSADQISYIISTCGFITMDSSVSNIVWKLQNFPDKTPTPINVVVRYLMYSNASWQKWCIKALDDMALGRLGTHAVLSKLVLELKYGA